MVHFAAWFVLCVWLEYSYILCHGAVVLVSMLLHWHKCCHFYCPPVYIWSLKRLLCFRSLYYTIMHFSSSQSRPTHLKLINFIILMSGQEYELESSSLHEFSPASFYFLPFGSKRFSQHPLIKPLALISKQKWGGLCLWGCYTLRTSKYSKPLFRQFPRNCS